MSTFSPRIILLPVAATLATFVLPIPAFADEAAQVCEGVFDAPINPAVRLVTNPPARSDARPGDVLNIDATWNPDGWDSLSSAAACVKVSGTLDPALSKVETPSPGAGVAHHQFTIANGYFAGTALCTRYRLVGDPAGPETQANVVSNQSCVEVHPEEDEQNHTTPTTIPPTTVTTVATPTKPAEATPERAVPVPTDNGATPQSPLEDRAGPPSDIGVAVPTVEGTKTSPPARPIFLTELPRTGSHEIQLGQLGAGTAAAGLFLLALARLTDRRRRTVQ